MIDAPDLHVQNELTDLRQRLKELERALASSRHREEALRKNEERLRQIFDKSDEGGWEMSLPAGEVYLSPSWFKLLGFEPGELPVTGETWIRQLHPDDAPAVTDAFNRCVRGEVTSYELEHRMLHKSGEWLWFVSRGRTVERDEQGRPLRVLGTLSDITRRKAAEVELRRSQTLLHALVENSPAIIFVRDLENRLILINKRHAAVLGLNAEQILGKADHELVSPEVIAEHRKMDELVRASGEPVTAEECVSLGGQRFTFLSTKFPLHDESGTIFAIGSILTDISERKRAEEERVALRERVIDAQRAALRELSTPLLPIADGVVVAPLIGTIDSQRAQQFMEAMLGGVTEHRAATVILDVTGVEVVDTHVAGALVRASRAVRLLGAEVVLTGIRPDVARTLAHMGADLESIVIHGSLRSGVIYAINRGNASRSREMGERRPRS